MSVIKKNPLATVALVALAAVLFTVWPHGTAQARMNPPIVALTMDDETTGGGTAPLSSAVFSIDASKGAAAARFTVWVRSGSAAEEFGFWYRSSDSDTWQFKRLLGGTAIADTDGAQTGVLGLRPGWEYSFDFEDSTEGTILAEILYDGVS